MSTKIRCTKCNDVIESKHRHDFVRCSCGAVAVDGGDDYLRIVGNLHAAKIVNDDGTERGLFDNES